LSTASLYIQNGVRVNILQKNPYKARQGNKVILDCVAEGRVHLSMEWRKEQTYFSETNVFQQDGKFRLIIDEVSIDDSGFYVCSASSGSERFKKSIQLIVESVHYPEPQVKSEKKLIVAQINTTVELRCFALTDDVKVKINWRRENVDFDFRFKNENGILRIQQVQINDTGLYTCLGFFGDNKVFIDHTKLAVVGK
jgi:PREDICTED: LOW QUALITY PROTEIN: papilin-like